MRGVSSFSEPLDVSGMTVAQVNAVIDDLNEAITDEIYADIAWEWERPYNWWVDGAVSLSASFEGNTGDALVWAANGWLSHVWFTAFQGALLLAWKATQMSVNRGSFINVYGKNDGADNISDQALADSGALDGTPKRVLLPHVDALTADYTWQHMIFFDMTWQQYQDAFM